MAIAVSQEILTPPTRKNDESTADWRARYRAAYLALIAELLALPGIMEADTHPWASDPNIVILRTSAATFAPGFQFAPDGNPIELVQSVNHRLALHYRDGVGVPWGGREIPRFVWWLKIHPELDVPPVELLGTARESALVELAADSHGVR